MHLKWILLISSCLILSASSARKGGGGCRSSNGPRRISRGATTFRRPSTVLSSSPRFSSSPSFSDRAPRPPRTGSVHVARAASAPPLSSISQSPFPNSRHVPKTASAPPLSSLSNPSPGGSRIPPPPPLPPNRVAGNPGIPKPPPPPRAPNSVNPTSPKTSGSGIPAPPPPPPHAPVSSKLSQNAPKSGSGKAAPSSETVITPVVVSTIMRIPPKHNSTNSNKNSKNSQNPNSKNSNTANYPNNKQNTTAQINLSKLPLLKSQPAGKNSTGGFKKGINAAKGNAFNSTIKVNLSKLPLLKSQPAGKNSTGGFKKGINAAKGNAFNSTIKGSPKNTLIGNASARNATGSAKLNGTVINGNNTRRNFTLSSTGRNALNGSLLANHTRHNNTRNATNSGVATTSQVQTSLITKFPWEGVKTGNPQQTATNNISPWDVNRPQNYDDNNGDAPRKSRSDNSIGILTKKIIKGVSTPPNGPKTTGFGLDSGLNGQSWDANRNEYAWKSSVNNTPPKPQSKIMKNQIILITVLISVILIAAGVIVYFCNRK